MIMKKKIPMLGIRPISYSCAITNCDMKNNAPFLSPVMSVAKEVKSEDESKVVNRLTLKFLKPESPVRTQSCQVIAVQGHLILSSDFQNYMKLN